MKTHRLLHEIYCWFSLCLFFPCYYYGGPLLFFLQTIFGGGLASFIDWHISPTFRNNVHRIVKRGLSPSPFLPTSRFLVLLNVYATIFTSEAIAVGLVVATGGYQSAPRLDVRLLVHMAATILVGEGVFCLTHRYVLHSSWGAPFHEIHHTCRPSSFSTSFTFHFCDSMTEFTFSHCCMAAFSHYCLKDPFSLLCTLQITYLWYSVWDHSENLKLPHYFHHQFISANYTAYVHQKPNWFKGWDGVREIVEEKKRQELEEKEASRTNQTMSESAPRLLRSHS